ncbi:MAG TPA: glycoside hydrolase family 47 protein [Solirubrobacteraceae bacterium]|nr:glycoside hydrolase family 47 protein [Solirubrobacteraceae bacterium]
MDRPTEQFQTNPTRIPQRAAERLPAARPAAGRSISRRAFLGTALSAGGAAALATFPGQALAARNAAQRHQGRGVYPPAPRQVNGPPAPWSLGPGDPEVAQFVVDEFLHAYDGYARYAYGQDLFLPLSKTGQAFFVPGHSVGLSIIEALDTLYVMGLDDQLADGVRWIHHNLDFDIDGDFHVFEAIIRLVGGLEAGYLATGDRYLLSQCVDIADRLLPAFTRSPSGMPYQYVNLHTGAVSGSQPPLAEVGTNILEFGVLSQLTGDPKYFHLAKRAQRAAIRLRSKLGLLATTIDVESGTFVDSTDQAPNPPVDSFYEYLWGGWAMFSDREDLRWFRETDRAMRRAELETYDGHVQYRQVDYLTGATVSRQVSELTAFWPEVLGHAGELGLARAYYDTFTAALDAYEVIPDEWDYSTGQVLGKSNEFRPEYPNAAFDLYLQTGDDHYARTALQWLQNMKANASVVDGYTIITDVTTRPMTLGDLMPAYAFAEGFKYVFLIFSRTPRFDRRNFYLSTEGKILRGLLPVKVRRGQYP